MAGKILGTDDDNDFDFFSQMAEHDDLIVGGESGKDSRGMHVVDEFPAELQVELPTKLTAPLGDMFGLELNVLLTVETDFMHVSS